ncbi:MAG: 30S ribosomal protein S8 [Deltaproteobacteria bacterium]|nr:30S ribosomal protein S8 [Deltaproteobacteria bacterium]
MLTDPLADMLTIIRNANKAKFEKADIPSSRLKVSVANLLKREGYIKDFKVLSGDNNKKTLRIFLRYDEQNQPIISGLKRVSKPSLRIYSRENAIPSVMSGMGLAILSTSKGVVTDREARNLQIGGEVLCFVW